MTRPVQTSRQALCQPALWHKSLRQSKDRVLSLFAVQYCKWQASTGCYKGLAISHCCADSRRGSSSCLDVNICFAAPDLDLSSVSLITPPGWTECGSRCNLLCTDNMSRNVHVCSDIQVSFGVVSCFLIKAASACAWHTGAHQNVLQIISLWRQHSCNRRNTVKKYQKRSCNLWAW